MTNASILILCYVFCMACLMGWSLRLRASTQNPITRVAYVRMLTGITLHIAALLFAFAAIAQTSGFPKTNIALVALFVPFLLEVLGLFAYPNVARLCEEPPSKSTFLAGLQLAVSGLGIAIGLLLFVLTLTGVLPT